MSQLNRIVGLLVVAGVLGLGCSQQQRGPTSPSATLIPEQATTWACGRIANETGGANGGWVFHEAVPTCATQPWLSETAGDGVITVAPGNLRSTVTGTTVRLDWDAVAGVTAFLVEAGSAPTLANLAAFNTGNAATTLAVQNVPAGTFYLRVRGVGPDGIAGPASNEIILRVGTSCASAPGAPTGFAAQVAGNQVTLSWAAGAGDAPASYVLEAGSAPGSSNLVVYDTGTATPGLAGTAPNGTYYVRVRGRNACGTGPASNEFIVGVPNGSGPPQPPGPCTYTVTPSSVSLSAIAGEFQVRVDTGASCAWTASSLSPFITLSGSGSGSGSGAARFNATANSGGATRSGSVRIAYSGTGQTIPVSQVAPPPPPPTPTPRVEDVIVVVPNPPGQPPVVQTVTPVPTPPPPPRPDASTGPALSAPQVSAGPSAGTIGVRLRSNQPFNTVIVATGSGTTAGDGAIARDVSSSHYVITLTSLLTEVTLTFAVQTGTPFNAQFGAAVGSELPTNYVEAPVAQSPFGGLIVGCDETRINFGQTISGALTDSDCGATLQTTVRFDFYVFTGQAGQAVNVRMTPGTLRDPFVYLFEPTSGFVEIGFDGVITGARLPASGTYYIVTFSFDSTGTGRGTYTLSLTSGGSDMTSAAMRRSSTAMSDANATRVRSVEALVRRVIAMKGSR